jgi:hypothetical protein
MLAVGTDMHARVTHTLMKYEIAGVSGNQLQPLLTDKPFPQSVLPMRHFRSVLPKIGFLSP